MPLPKHPAPYPSTSCLSSRPKSQGGQRPGPESPKAEERTRPDWWPITRSEQSSPRASSTEALQENPETKNPMNEKPAAYNPNITAKSRFQQKPANLSNHRAVVDTEAFTRGVDFAMLEYVDSTLSSIRDQGTAMVAGIKLLGAHEFLREFRDLSEVQTPIRPPTIVDNLPDPSTPKRQ